MFSHKSSTKRDMHLHCASNSSHPIRRRFRISFRNGMSVVFVGLTNITSLFLGPLYIVSFFLFLCMSDTYIYILRSAFLPDPYWSLGSHKSQRNVSFSLPGFYASQQNNHKNKGIPQQQQMWTGKCVGPPPSLKILFTARPLSIVYWWTFSDGPRDAVGSFCLTF